MDLEFKVEARIARPVGEVVEAVADPAQLSRYFTTGGAEGRIETGATVTWDFHDFPGAFPVEVVEVVPGARSGTDRPAMAPDLRCPRPSVGGPASSRRRCSRRTARPPGRRSRPG